jgi:N-acetylglucosamine-6-sulfatase
MRLAATAVLAALGCLALAGPAAGAPPNVVVFMTDDQTASSVSAMPNVQRLIARQGATFDNSFASFPLCCPSRATFLTGQYAHNHGVFDNVLPRGGFAKLDHSNTLATWLSDAGYRTIHVGKYLNGYGYKRPRTVPPGWTDWHALVGASVYQYFGFTMNDNGRTTRYPRTPAFYQTDVLARKAVDMVRTASRGTRPFFMWNAFVAPHFSFTRRPEPDDPPNYITRTPVPAPRDRNRFSDEPLPMPPSFNEEDISDKPDTVRFQHPPINDRVRAAIKESYQQELESLQSVDRAIGQVVAELERTGQLDRTLIVFTSDNGYFHGEHRLPREKILPYEPAIRVPLMIRGPGVPVGVHRDQLVSNQDLAPTILDLTRVEAKRVLDGVSLLPLARHPGLEVGRDLLIEGLYRRKTARAVAFSGVRTRHWFYAEYSNGERELYDLERDPDEMVNRDLEPGFAGVEANLAHRLAELRRCAGDECRSPPRLEAELDYRTELSREGILCAGSDVRLRIRGPDRVLVTGVDVWAGGRVIATSSGGRRDLVLPRSSLPPGDVLLLPTAYLDDDRAYTPATSLTVCGHAAGPPLPVVGASR